MIAPRGGFWVTLGGWLFAAGGLGMTAHDLALWDIALIEGKVLRPESHTAMQSITRLANGVGTTYGLGVNATLVGVILILALTPGTILKRGETSVQDKVGAVILPGSSQVLDRETGELVDCDAERCPHATDGINHAPFAAFGGFLFLNTLYLQDVRGLSPVGAGLATVPMALRSVGVPPRSGRAGGRHRADVPRAVGAGARRSSPSSRRRTWRASAPGPRRPTRSPTGAAR